MQAEHPDGEPREHGEDGQDNGELLAAGVLGMERLGHMLGRARAAS